MRRAERVQTASERFLARFQRRGVPAHRSARLARPARQMLLIELQGDLFAGRRVGQGSGSGVSALVTPTLSPMGGSITHESLDE